MQAPDLDVWLTDTNPDHVAWCAASLPRVHSFLVSPLVEEAKFPVPFDGVVAISVFTHLPRHLFESWLRLLRANMRPDGLLIPTLHGKWALNYVAQNPTLQRDFRMSAKEAQSMATNLDAERFVYRRYDAPQISAAQAGEDYGLTFVSESEFAAMAEAAGFSLIEYRVAGLRGWQDVAVLRAR